MEGCSVGGTIIVVVTNKNYTSAKGWRSLIQIVQGWLLYWMKGGYINSGKITPNNKHIQAYSELVAMINDWKMYTHIYIYFIK